MSTTTGLYSLIFRLNMLCPLNRIGQNEDVQRSSLSDLAAHPWAGHSEAA
jgi:hypothetical protein